MYSCSDNPKDFYQFYHPQNGEGANGSLFYRADLRRQKGHGIGGIFGTIGRYLIPFVKKFILPNATNMVKNVATDLIDKKANWRDSLKEHGINALKGAGRDILNQSGSGFSRRKKRTHSKDFNIQIRKPPRKRRKKSIKAPAFKIKKNKTKRKTKTKKPTKKKSKKKTKSKSKYTSKSIFDY